ncbi:MAG TPA: uroporphyrinogen-III synthase, partial [Bryobacteraceae bacterium]|nr:uroporphyrinogen-III synthase [Bryobacteraceae bacterium]
MAFSGARVLALESRRGPEIAELIRRQGGEPFLAPSMREVPAVEDSATHDFARRLLAGEFDLMILLTGVGTRQLNRWIAAHYGENAFARALAPIAVVARGPKPAAALREIGITPALVAPEPNTWREVLAVTEGRPESRIAIQEYGRPSPELVAALHARGASVTPVRVYQWDLPENLEPLREAARKLAAREFRAVLFTSGMQIVHLLRVAEAQGISREALEGLRQALVASIGPA